MPGVTEMGGYRMFSCQSQVPSIGAHTKHEKVLMSGNEAYEWLISYRFSLLCGSSAMLGGCSVGFLTDGGFCLYSSSIWKWPFLLYKTSPALQRDPNQPFFLSGLPSIIDGVYIQNTQIATDSTYPSAVQERRTLIPLRRPGDSFAYSKERVLPNLHEGFWMGL